MQSGYTRPVVYTASNSQIDNIINKSVYFQELKANHIYCFFTSSQTMRTTCYSQISTLPWKIGVALLQLFLQVTLQVWLQFVVLYCNFPSFQAFCCKVALFY